MFKKINLVQRFLIFSAIAVFIAGIVLVQVLTYTAGLYAMKNEQSSIIYVIESIIGPRVATEASLDGIAQDKPFLEDMARNLIRFNDVVSLKLWDTNGTILYCTEAELIGKTFELKDNLQKALQGTPFYSVSVLDDSENEHLKQSHSRLIEMYYPIRNGDGKIIGVYEIYKSYESIRDYIRSLSVYIWVVIFSGLLLLYLFLFKSIKSAYITLIEQNDRLREVNSELKNAYLDTIASFSAAVDLKDVYTKNHSQRTTKYALKIARKLALNEQEMDSLEKAALFHDIGKIGIPDQILNKPDKLTDEEFEIIKSHSEKGAELIGRVKFLSNIVLFIRHHHERIDGKGYPGGLKGEEIPLEARIIAVSDTYDAITTDRPYRKAASTDAAIHELQRVKGIQLDDRLVDIFIEILNEEGQ